MPTPATRPSTRRRPARCRPVRRARRWSVPRTASRRIRRCRTRAACSRSSSGTSPATPRRWSSGSAARRPEQFRAVCEAWVGDLRPGEHGALVYSVGWTQHSVGAQYIRGGAIIQLLLGNIGRPGGGVFALRGHASIQGSTDIPTLFNLLPGYLPMPSGGARRPRGLPGRRPQPHPEGLLVGRGRLHGVAAQGVLR